MSNDGVNQSRRKFLLGATGVVGGAGLVGAAVPFVASWQPSAKAKAAGAPVRVNISKLEAGGRLVVEWRGKPVYIVRRTQESLEALGQIEAASLKDANSESANQPTYVGGNARSLKGKKKCWFWLDSVHTLAVRQCTDLMSVRLTSVAMLGWVVFSVPVMVRHSICLVVFLSMYQHPQI